MKPKEKKKKINYEAMKIAMASKDKAKNTSALIKK